MKRPFTLHPVPPAKQSPQEKLNSWKEIASYLNRTTRTVMRWEKQEGLPVHRLGHGKRGSVYAYAYELDAWWEGRRLRLEETNQAVGTPEVAAETPAAWKINRRPAAVALALIVILGVGSWMAWRHFKPAVEFKARDWVLVADFENQTGDPLFDKSLWAAFVVSLQQSPYCNVFPGSRIGEVVRRMGKDEIPDIDEPLAREICLRENIKCYLLCTISRAGSQFALSSRLFNTRTGEVIRAYSERPETEEDIIDGLDHIAARIRQDIGESLASIRANTLPLPQVTTSSLQALRLYAEGERLWNRGEYKQAVACYQGAIERDPGFAMACAALGKAYMSHVLPVPEEGKKYYALALKNSRRVTERERMFIQASNEASLGHLDPASQLFRLYLRTYPDDMTVRYDFGTLLMLNGRTKEAIEQLKETIRLNPEHAGAHINLATAMVTINRPEEALASYERAFQLEPGWKTLANLNHEYGFTLVSVGELAQARELFHLAEANPDTRAAGLRSLALLDMAEGKYNEAKDFLGEAIVISRAQGWTLTSARNYLFLAQIAEAQGNPPGQAHELDNARHDMSSLPEPPSWLVSRIGVGFARLGSIQKAETIAEILRSRIDRESPKDTSFLHLLEGEIAISREEFDSGIETLLVADQEAGTPETIAALADAYDRTGDGNRALEYYEKLVDGMRPALGFEAQQPWIEGQVRLAELYSSMGQNEKARMLLDTLERMRREPDAGLPLSKRIALLRSGLQ